MDSGKVTLIGLWATWCEACPEYLHLLDEFLNIYKNEVKVVAVSIDDARHQREIEPYLATLSLKSLPIMLDPFAKLGALSSKTSAPLALAGQIPATYLITGSGAVAGYIAGVADWRTPAAQNLISCVSKLTQ